MTAPLRVRNPYSGDVDYEFRPASTEDISRLARDLRAHQPEWAALTSSRRFDVLDCWGRAVMARKDEIAAALIADTGRYRLSVNEVTGTPGKIERWREQATKWLRPEGGVSDLDKTLSFESQLVPYPLVAIVSPWNFPLSLALIDALPAVIAGCSVYIKPSEVTPRFIEPIMRSVEDVPELARVFRFIQGDGATGAAMIDAADMVCFTGSVKTGRLVSAQAGRNFIPAFLEMGGKDPAIVTRSADLERASDAVLRQSIVNAGQVCYSLERIYVEASVFDKFVDLLATKAKRTRINYPDMRSGHIGPIIFDKQIDIIEDHLRDAYAKGARALAGGTLERHGHAAWCPATVLIDVSHDMKIMREETFGPIAPVMPYRDEDEAVRLANDTQYGLAAAVFAGTKEEGLRIARRLDAGGISINDAGLHARTQTEAEKHGFKSSGLGGSRMGPAGLLRFFRKKVIVTRDGAPSPIDAFAES